MTVATKIAVELVHFRPDNPRAADMFRALIASAPSAGLDLWESNAYVGGADWLLLWGPGAPARAEVLRRHVSRGGHVLAFDLAYWQRNQKIRVSFDHAHPQAFVMRKPLPETRLINDGIALTNDWNPNGPIVIAGLGPKALVQYGKAQVAEWEADMMRACRARWTRPVIYRPKKDENDVPTWATRVSRGGSIEDVLRGASLVITWHSNVAIDAIRMGIPVVCRDGAAAAVCSAELTEAPTPLLAETRDRFLANLAWFQWRPDEAKALWRFAQEMLS